MNRLKKELIKAHMYPASKEHTSEGDAVQLEGARVRIYSSQFIRVSVYYNVLTVDYVIDAEHFNKLDMKQVEVFHEGEFDFDGKSLRSEALKYYPAQYEIREYDDGLRLYSHWLTGELLFAEKR